jgi:hypothetical protein
MQVDCVAHRSPPGPPGQQNWGAMHVPAALQTIPALVAPPPPLLLRPPLLLALVPVPLPPPLPPPLLLPPLVAPLLPPASPSPEEFAFAPQAAAANAAAATPRKTVHE